MICIYLIFHQPNSKVRIYIIVDSNLKKVPDFCFLFQKINQNLVFGNNFRTCGGLMIFVAILILKYSDLITQTIISSQYKQVIQANMQKNEQKMVFAYWALRGKPHIIRLLMEYLRIPYEEVTFKSPKVWENQGKEQFRDLPCLRDGDFMIHQLFPIITYILKKHNHHELLGKTFQHQAYVEMHMWSTETLLKKIMSSSVKETKSVEELVKIKQDLWNRDVQRALNQMQEFPLFQQYYLGYLSIVDFDMFEMFHYVHILYPTKAQKFTKLNQLSKKMAATTGIKQFCQSQKGREHCFLPVQMIKKFKNQQNQQSSSKTNKT